MAALALGAFALLATQMTDGMHWDEQQFEPVPMAEVEETVDEPEPEPVAPIVFIPTVWDRLAQCESGGNWAANTGNGYYGGLQFLISTWRANSGTGLPHQNSRAEQIRVAMITQARAGWGQWPACSRRLGLR